MTDPPRIVVVGAGGVGSLLAARLDQGHRRVLLIGRPASVDAIRTHGLVVEGETRGVFRIDAKVAIPRGSNAESVLLTVKTFDAPEAATETARALPNPVPVLLPQNGIDFDMGVREALVRAGWPPGAVRLVRAVNTIPVTLLAPGRVRHAGPGELLLGPIPADSDRGAVDYFIELLRSGGIEARWADNIDREVWRKLLVNAAINPVTADHRVPNGRLADDPWRGQALILLREALEVARAEGYSFSEKEVEADLFRVVRSTAANRSSMLQDVERGRPTEVDAISGALLERGRRRGLRLPATERIVGRFRGGRPLKPAQPS